MAKDKGKSFGSKGELLAILNQLQTEADGKGRAETAQGIAQLIQDLNADNIDHTQVSIKGRIRLKKFNGPRLPESVPVETQDFITDV